MLGAQAQKKADTRGSLFERLQLELVPNTLTSSLRFELIVMWDFPRAMEQIFFHVRDDIFQAFEFM